MNPLIVMGLFVSIAATLFLVGCVVWLVGFKGWLHLKKKSYRKSNVTRK